MKNKTVFIAEDNPIIAMNIEQILKNAGIKIISLFNDPNSLYNNSLSNPPDLIITEITFKNNKDTLEYYNTLCNEYHIPLIFITSHNFEDYRKRLHCPHCYFLSKPFDVDSLMGRLKNLFGDAVFK